MRRLSLPAANFFHECSGAIARDAFESSRDWFELSGSEIHDELIITAKGRLRSLSENIDQDITGYPANVPANYRVEIFRHRSTHRRKHRNAVVDAQKFAVHRDLTGSFCTKRFERN